MATIYLHGKVVHCKTFENFEDAVAARKCWEKELFGEFACQNPERLPTRPRGVDSLTEPSVSHLEEFC